MPTVQSKNKDKNDNQQEKKGDRQDEKLMEPGEYEVTKDSVFTVRVPLRRHNGWWVVVDNEDYAEIVEEVEFRMWTYDEMVEMRKNAMKYDQSRSVHMIDHDVLNRLKMQKLMKSWTFSRNNPRLDLHHANGVLTDESWDAVKRLQTNIINYLIEKMNERYEYGL